MSRVPGGYSRTFNCHLGPTPPNPWQAVYYNNKIIPKWLEQSSYRSTQIIFSINSKSLWSAHFGRVVMRRVKSQATVLTLQPTSHGYFNAFTCLPTIITLVLSYTGDFPATIVFSRVAGSIRCWRRARIHKIKWRFVVCVFIVTTVNDRTNISGQCVDQLPECIVDLMVDATTQYYRKFIPKPAWSATERQSDGVDLIPVRLYKLYLWQREV